MMAVADPGFPVGGVDPLGGHGPRHGCLLPKMYAKTKELGPVGGVCRARPARSANGWHRTDNLKLPLRMKNECLFSTIMKISEKRGLNPIN